MTSQAIGFDVLLARAGAALAQAHAPFSRLRVGAAVLTAGGNVYTGCNVESVAFPVGGCAEHHAIAAAVLAEGPRMRLVRVAVAARDRNDAAAAVPPCGACRQLIHEFGPDAKVAFLAQSGEVVQRAIGVLLPDSFTLDPADTGDAAAR